MTMPKYTYTNYYVPDNTVNGRRDDLLRQIAALTADLARIQKQLTESTTGQGTEPEKEAITRALNIDIAKVQAALTAANAELAGL
jgi:hypothetical protein